MSTLAVTFSFNTDTQGFVATPGANVTSMIWDNSSLCLTQTRTLKANSSASSRWDLTTTWEGLGVPANSVITGVTAASMQSRAVTYNSGGATNSSGPATLTDGANVVTLSATRGFTGADPGFIPTNGVDATGLNLASSNSISIRINNVLSNTNATGSSIVLKQDTLTFTITYNLNFPVSASDTAGTTDASSVTARLGVAVSDTSSTTDASNALGVVSAGRTDTAATSDLMSGTVVSAPACHFLGYCVETTLMVVNIISGGPLLVGMALSGGAVVPGTLITAQGTGTGGSGSYTVSPAQTFVESDITAVATSGATDLSDSVATSDAISGTSPIFLGTFTDTVVTSDAPNAAGNYNVSQSPSVQFIGFIVSNLLMVVQVTSGGPMAIGLFVSGSGVLPGTQIVALGTGTGSSGSYYLNNQQTVGDTAFIAFGGGDAVATSDVASLGSSLSVSNADSVATSDAISDITNYARAASDAAATSDSVNVQAAFSIANIDSTASTDNVSTTKDTTTGVADTIATSDTPSGGITNTGSLIDTVATGDVIDGFLASVRDSVATSDTLTGSLAVTGTVADSVATSDSRSAVGSFNPVHVETAVASDTVNATATASVGATDTVAVSDNTATSSFPGSNFVGNLIDNVTATDAMNVTNVSWAIAQTDTAVISGVDTTTSQYVVSVSDSGATSDNRLGGWGTSDGVVDSVSTGDAANVGTSGTIMQVIDNASASDVLNARYDVNVGRVDVHVTADIIATAAVYAVVVNDTAPANDNSFGDIGIKFTVTDVVVTSDVSSVGTFDYFINQIDVQATADSMNTTANLHAGLTDTAVATDDDLGHYFDGIVDIVGANDDISAATPLQVNSRYIGTTGEDQVRAAVASPRRIGRAAG